MAPEKCKPQGFGASGQSGAPTLRRGLAFSPSAAPQVLPPLHSGYGPRRILPLRLLLSGLYSCLQRSQTRCILMSRGQHRTAFSPTLSFLLSFSFLF